MLKKLQVLTVLLSVNEERSCLAPLVLLWFWGGSQEVVDTVSSAGKRKFLQGFDGKTVHVTVTVWGGNNSKYMSVLRTGWSVPAGSTEQDPGFKNSAL